MDLRYLDAHCHADLLLERDPSFPEHYRRRGCGGISWSFPEHILSWTDYPEYWGRLQSMAQRLTDEGIPLYYLVGIHPRCIPDDLEEEGGLPGPLVESLWDHLTSPLCLGFGEIGLDRASDLEGRVLRWQLDFARGHLPQGKGIGIHTPRADKVRVTQDILSLLREYPELKEQVLLDHLTPETYPAVQGEGFDPVGMTLQPGKLAVEELVAFLREDPKRADSVVLGSDGARQLSEWFFHFLDHQEALSDDERRKLLLENARSFWRIEQ